MSGRLGVAYVHRIGWGHRGKLGQGCCHVMRNVILFDLTLGTDRYLLKIVERTPLKFKLEATQARSRTECLYIKWPDEICDLSRSVNIRIVK